MLRRIRLVHTVERQKHDGHNGELSCIDTTQQVVQCRSQQIHNRQTAQTKRQQTLGTDTTIEIEKITGVIFLNFFSRIRIITPPVP